jgi:hypothetical protein
LDKPSIVAGLALIVIAFALFSSLLLDRAILILTVLEVLIVLGVVFLAFGFEVFGKMSAGPGRGSRRDSLTALDRTILEMVSEKKGKDEIANATGVSTATISQKWTALATGGYVSENQLTEKGYEALHGRIAEAA